MTTRPPPLPPSPLEYGGYAPESRESDVSDWVLAFLSPFLSFGTLFGIIALAMVVVIPRFEQTFRDFRLDLPGPTKVLLSISRWFANDYGWAYSVAACTALAAGLAFLYVHGRRRGRWFYPLIATLLLIGAMVFVILALYLPMISIVDGISVNSSGKK